MNSKRFCCIRPNFCSPCEIQDLRNLPTGYIYAVDTVKSPVTLHQFQSALHRTPELWEFNQYKWDKLIELGLTGPNSESAVLLLVRPHGSHEAQKIHEAYFTPAFHGDINTCTFCMNDVCLRHASDSAPTFCNKEYKEYGDARVYWGAVTRAITDAWLPKQEEMRDVVRDYITSLTRAQRKVLLADKQVPIGALIVNGIVDKELFC